MSHSLEELARIAEQNGEALSDRALIQLNLAITTEMWKQIRSMSEKVEELEDHPSLLWLLHYKTRATLLVIFLFTFGVITVYDLGLIEKLFNTLGLL